MRAHLRRPRDLSDDERAAWCAMQDHQAAYQTPFLSPQHALVADTVMDDVWVLVISDDHGPTAFLPLQRTGDRGRPLLDACNDGDGMVQALVPGGSGARAHRCRDSVCPAAC